MLSAAGHPARPARPLLARPTQLARLGLACMLALTVILALAVITAAPTRADTVRDDQQWVLNKIDLPAAWNVSRGQGVTVAVIDSGVNPNVPDLAGSVVSGPDLTGVGTPPESPGWGMHGTWMASLVAGHGHDGGGDGVIGAAPLAHVLSIRVITDKSDPGYARYEREPLGRGQRQLAKAIRYAVRHGAGVISMSLGYSASSRTVRSALQDALDHNVVVVASSGNSGDAADASGRGQAPDSFPANYLGVLGVAAVNKAGRPANFSSENLSVQVAAPGVHVPAEGADSGYWLVSGTSPACALTAGVAALIKSKYPALSPAMIRQAITGTTSSRPPGGYNDQVGFGTLDAAAALTAAGQLAGQVPHRHGLIGQHRFGGGPRAIPPVPIGPRGAGTLVLLCLLGAGCLALVIAAARRLVVIRRAPVPAGLHGGEATATAEATAGAGAAGGGGGSGSGGVAGGGGGGGGGSARPLPRRHPGWTARPGGRPDSGRLGSTWADSAGSGSAGSDSTQADSTQADSAGSGSAGSGSAGSGATQRSGSDTQLGVRPESGPRAPVLPRFTWQPGPTGRHAASSDQNGAAEAGE